MKEKQNYHITTQDVKRELLIILKDEYLANYEAGEDFIIVKFLNGQRFTLSIKENAVNPR